MRKKYILRCLLLLALVLSLATYAFAITESDVESAISASGKEAVSGNVFVWFLCAIAFLKVSQRIDSFLSSLGLNVGHTGGSMLSEAMISMRAISTATNAVGSALGSHTRHSPMPTAGKSSTANAAAAGFFSGGLVGMASRKISSDAVRSATTEKNIMQPQQSEATVSQTHTSNGSHSAFQSSSDQRSSSRQSLHEKQHSMDSSQLQQNMESVQEQQFHSAMLTEEQQASHMAFQTEQDSFAVSAVQADELESSAKESRAEQARQHSAQSERHFFSIRNGLTKSPTAPISPVPSSENAQTSRPAPIPFSPAQFRSFGGAMFAKSLHQGGTFANDVIGTVAKGDYRTTGSITGDTAARSLMSYMGITALGEHAANTPRYQNVEIGGGRITGREFTPEHPAGIDFCMYHADQYAQPTGNFSRVYSADDAAWYKQYAADTVERKPYQAEDGKIAYHEQIVQKLPNPPQRKDRM